MIDSGHAELCSKYISWPSRQTHPKTLREVCKRWLWICDWKVDQPVSWSEKLKFHSTSPTHFSRAHWHHSQSLPAASLIHLFGQNRSWRLLTQFLIFSPLLKQFSGLIGLFAEQNFSPLRRLPFLGFHAVDAALLYRKVGRRCRWRNRSR